MNFLKFLLNISWKQIVIATVAGLISGTSSALIIALINQEVHQSHWVNALLYFSLLVVIIVVMSIISQLMLVYLSQNTIYQLRLKLSENILTAPLQHLEQLRENRLIVSFSEDVHVLTLAISSLPNICIDLATVIGCFIYLAWFSPLLFLLAILWTLSSIWFVQTRLNKAQRWFFQARNEEDTLLKHFQAIITGIKELKLNRNKRQEFIEKNLATSADKLRQKNTKAMKRFVTANAFGQMSQFVSLGLILFILPLFLKLDQATLATYVLINTFMTFPIHNLLNRIPELVRGNIALQKIQRMKLSLSYLAEFKEQPAPILEQCELELKQVCYLYPPSELPPDFDQENIILETQPQGFSNTHHPVSPNGHHPDFNNAFPPHPPYGNFNHNNNTNGHQPPHPENHLDKFPHPHPPHPYPLENPNFPPPPEFYNGNGFNPHPHFLPEKGFQLGPINLTLKPGQLVFIIGGNGSGKSTLAKVITGLYEPQSGEIYLNNKLITETNLEWYRQHFSAIFSDFYLFDSYLGFNDPNLDQKILNYLHLLKLAHKVQVKNGVLSTINLSFGQRKRLALLNVYLENRPIYLFDEWAADQEPEFREFFYQHLLKELKEQGKIVIVITHDDRYFHLADHLIKLDYGQVEFNRTCEQL
jgi:putative ATP-binding cassette transporter